MGDPRYKTPRWHRLRNPVIRRDGRICAKPGCSRGAKAARRWHGPKAAWRWRAER